MSKEIIAVLDALAQKFGMAIDWTASNVWPYIEELCGKYVNYEIVTSVIWMIFALIMYIPIVILFKLLNKNKDFGVEHYYGCSDDRFGRYLSYIGVAALCVISVLILLTQIFDIVTCLTFPEMMIINYIRILAQ